MHLEPWPDLSAEFETERLAMQRIQQVVELGRSARSANNIKTRQFLGFGDSGDAEPDAARRHPCHLAIVREELNVRDVPTSQRIATNTPTPRCVRTSGF